MQQFQVTIRTKIDPNPFIKDWYAGNIQYHFQGGIGNIRDYLIVTTNSMEIVSETEILQEMKDLFHNQPIIILNVQEI